MKKFIIWINISSIALVLLGIIHLAAVPVVIKMFSNLIAEQFSTFLFMYLTAGIGTILPGLISKMQVQGLKKGNKTSRNTILVCSVYTVFMGAGAVILMADNPFAYLGFVIGISLLIPSMLIRVGE